MEMALVILAVIVLFIYRDLIKIHVEKEKNEMISKTIKQNIKSMKRANEEYNKVKNDTEMLTCEEIMEKLNKD